MGNERERAHQTVRLEKDGTEIYVTLAPQREGAMGIQVEAWMASARVVGKANGGLTSRQAIKKMQEMARLIADAEIIDPLPDE